MSSIIVCFVLAGVCFLLSMFIAGLTYQSNKACSVHFFGSTNAGHMFDISVKEQARLSSSCHLSGHSSGLLDRGDKECLCCESGDLPSTPFVDLILTALRIT